MGYIWASEPVIAAISDLIRTLEEKLLADRRFKLVPPNAPAYGQAKAKADALDAKAQFLYQRCMFEMRKDAGFPNSNTEYRLVSFAPSTPSGTT